MVKMQKTRKLECLSNCSTKQISTHRDSERRYDGSARILIRETTQETWEWKSGPMGRKLARVPDALKMKWDHLFSSSSQRTYSGGESRTCNLSNNQNLQGKQHVHTHQRPRTGSHKRAGPEAEDPRTFQQLRSFSPQTFLETQWNTKYCT